MSYIDRDLLPGEHLVYRTRLYWLMFAGPVLLTALAMTSSTAASLADTCPRCRSQQTVGAVLLKTPAEAAKSPIAYSQRFRRFLLRQPTDLPSFI